MIIESMVDAKNNPKGVKLGDTIYVQGMYVGVVGKICWRYEGVADDLGFQAAYFNTGGYLSLLDTEITIAK